MNDSSISHLTQKVNGQEQNWFVMTAGFVKIVKFANIDKQHRMLSQNNHASNFYSISFSTSGYMYEETDLKINQYSPYTVLSCYPGEIRNINIADAEGWSICFTEDLFASVRQDLKDILKCHIFRSINALRITDPSAQKRMETLTKLMADNTMLADEPTVGKAYAYSAITMLLCLLSQSQEFAEQIGYNPESTPEDFKLYNRFLDKLETNYKRMHHAQYYAAEMGISMKSLNKICKKHGMKTAKDHLTDRILKEAKALLYLGEMRTNEITAELGFTEHANFTNFFRKATGMSPVAYKDYCIRFKQKKAELYKAVDFCNPEHIKEIMRRQESESAFQERLL